MKKLILAAVIGSIFSGAVLADTTYQIEHGDNKETSAKFDGDIIGGLHGGIELVGMDNLKHHKESTFSLAYKLDVSDSWYVEPSFDFTIPSNYAGTASYFEKTITPDNPDGHLIDAKYKAGNTSKFGIKTGVAFDNGLYTSARYRYEVRDGDFKSKFYAEEGRINDTLKATEKERRHRLDVKMGYQITEVVDLSANYIYRTGESSIDAKLAETKTDNSRSGKFNVNNDEIELKAQYLGFGDIQPYAMYTVKSDTKFDGRGDLSGQNSKFKNDNEFKMGVAFTF